MAAPAPEDNAAPPSAGGLLAAIRDLALTVVALLQTRLEIFASEVEEERLRLREFLWFAVATVFCLGFAIVLAAVFIVALLWDSFGVFAFGALCLAFLALGIGLAMSLRARARSRPRLFAATLGELAKDRERLEPRR